MIVLVMLLTQIMLELKFGYHYEIQIQNKNDVILPHSVVQLEASKGKKLRTKRRKTNGLVIIE